MVMLTSEPEREFRRRWYQAHVDRWRKALEGGDKTANWHEAIRTHAHEGRGIVDGLRQSGDLIQFGKLTNKWTIRMGQFKGFTGQMFINQLVNNAVDPEGLARFLPEALNPPVDDNEALRKISEMAAFVARIKNKDSPLAPGATPFFLSFCWALTDQTRPVLWRSAREFLEVSTGETLPTDPAERYARYMELVRELDTDYQRYVEMTGWWHQKKPLLMARDLLVILSDRCKFGVTYVDEVDAARRLSEFRANTQSLLSIATYIGNSLKDEMAEHLGRELKVVKPGKDWTKGYPRADLMIDWLVPEQYAPGLRLWINHQGMTICITPGIGPPDKYGGKGTEKRWYDKTAETAKRFGAEGFEISNCRYGKYGEDRGFVGRSGSFVYGPWYQREKLEQIDVLSECRAMAPQLRLTLDAWLDLYHDVEPGVTNGSDPSPYPKPMAALAQETVAALAEELLIGYEALAETIRLLEDKGQIVFYGPPGTGKTYMARKLAEALAPDDERRSFVQFHPSMSYEDFFEGYRPDVNADGTMTYRLTLGPLRIIAEQAAKAPGQCHVMIIDEINRADLPKVLGELLFLLEYRDEKVLPLYRPNEPFGLPANLWLIGTMNTADRSIALVDAALRRRFHFVPFFPDYGPMEGLLERWLAANNESSWVGNMVAGVNKELTETLGGPHLQLGASHFMKTGISDSNSGMLKLVWKYTIEPFIEEQLFDEPERIKHFRLDQVRQRYRSQVQPGEDQSRQQA